MIAYGTETGIIKIVSLKGYESEIYEAHSTAVKALVFVPNKGRLVSADESGQLCVWDLRDIMKDPIRVELPLKEEGDQG